MRAYELILVLRPSLKDDERKKLITTIKDYLGKPEIVKVDDWGQKTLSYPIKKETSGHYTRLMLEMEAEVPLDFEKRLITSDGILRHLLLRNKKLNIKNKIETKDAKESKSERVKESKPKAKTESKKKVVTPRRQGSMGQAKSKK